MPSSASDLSEMMHESVLDAYGRGHPHTEAKGVLQLPYSWRRRGGRTEPTRKYQRRDIRGGISACRMEKSSGLESMRTFHQTGLANAGHLALRGDPSPATVRRPQPAVLFARR